MIRSLRWPFWFLCVISLGTLATLPLWLTPGLPNSDDSLTHIFNLFALDQQIHNGEAFPLRFPDHGLGYGYAVLAYYPPLPYALLELIQLVVADYVLAFKLGFTLITIAAGLSSGWLGRSWFGLRGGLWMAALYLFHPYLLANLHIRGALAEQLGLAVGPLVILSIDQLARQPTMRTWLGATTAIALLNLSHFVSALLFLPITAIYTIWLMARQSPHTRLARGGWLIAAALGGALLSSFYWLPALLETSGLNQVDPQAALAAYQAEAIPLLALLNPSPLIGYANTHDIPELGLALWLLLGCALIGVIRPGQRGQLDQRGRMLVWAGSALLSLCAASHLFAPVWAWIPGIALLQFPFRWLGPAALAFAIFIAGALQTTNLPQGRWRAVSQPGLLILLGWYLVSGLVHLPTDSAMLRSMGIAAVTNEQINHNGLRAFEFDQADNLRPDCWVWAYEYVPRTTPLHRCPEWRDLILNQSAQPSNLPATAATLQIQALDANRLVARVTAEEPWSASLHAFALPGWRAQIDAQSVEPTASGPLGVISLPVPAGEHHITLEYGRSPLRRILLGLAALGGLGLLGLASRFQRGLATALILGVVLLIGAPWAVATQAAEPPPLINTAHEFGGQIALAGYGLQPASHGVRLELVWLARQSMADSYKVFVHIIDDQGTLWAQADSRPLRYASHTNRWLPGQIVLDPYELAWSTPLPPGRYQVRVGLYNEANGVRVPVIDAAGTPIDDQVWLDSFEQR